MLRVGELRSYAQNLARDEFIKQLGPFTLIQRPEDPELARAPPCVQRYAPGC